MPNQLDANGLTVATEDEIATDLAAGLSGIYGVDINLQAETPDGQMVGLFAQMDADVLDLIVDVYNMFSVSSAYGGGLQALVEVNGMTIKPGSYTTTAVNVTANAAGTLPGLDQTALPPYQLQDAAGNVWTLVSSYTFAGAATQALIFQASVLGVITPIPNSITIQATPLSFISSVNNPAFEVTTAGTVTSGSPTITGIASTAGMVAGMDLSDENGFFPSGTTVHSVDSASQITASANATGGAPTTENVTVAAQSTVIGTVAESDEQLRIRQAQSTALAATGIADAIEGQLQNLPNVTSAIVLENRTGAPSGGIPANGIWCVVVGGTPADIAQAIYSKATPGNPMAGAQSYTWIRKNGQGVVINWDVGVAQPLWLKFSIIPTVSGLTFDNTLLIQELAAALAAPYYALNQNANIGDIVRAMYKIEPRAIIVNPSVSIDGSAYSQQVSPTSAKYYFSVPAANIKIV